MASADDEHGWRDCPFYLQARVEDVDLAKTNHFYHDSLGCPALCGDDHNHPH